MTRRTILSAAALIATAAAPRVAAQQAILSPAGPAAAELAHLGWIVLVLFSIVSALVWVLIFWLGLRRPGRVTDAPDVAEVRGESWIVLGSVALPAAILAFMFVLTLQGMRAEPMPAHDRPPAIRLIGHQWWWEIEYQPDADGGAVTTANEIHIPAGVPVDIELISHDVIHSFWVPSLQGKVDLIPGVVNRVRVQASHAGVYHGQCAEYCGAEHGKMRLLIVADEPSQYRTWLAREREAAAAPASADAQRGAEVFTSSSCALCHAVRGTSARGRVGPELTHLASRRMIAANTLPNDTAGLTAWIPHAQTLKPGTQMPNTTLEATDLASLVAYLQDLK
jgi:cytochrome c oxidase subunit 2